VLKASLHGEIPAPDAVLSVLGETLGARIVDHDCRKPAGTRGSYEYGLDYGLVLIRRGGYWREVNGRSAYVGPTDAFFERPLVEQRLAHHRDGGDRCTSLWLSEIAICALAGDAAVPDDPLATTPAIDLRHRELVVALRRGIDRFELDERLARLARRSATRANHDRLVQQVREAIVSDPARADLQDIAQAVGHTRFHVSRVFSRVTGLTLSQFRNRVRVAMAMERLVDGHDNLAVLSADLGFVDQSHLWRVVRGSTGTSPSALLDRLGDRPSRRSVRHSAGA
jgi:AraC-like DNA-binding protein